MINLITRYGWQAGENTLAKRRQRPPGFRQLHRHPLRNRVIVLLAAKAGLRASEIAKLTWDMVLDPTGDIGSGIELRDAAAKNGSGRLIPVHPDLRPVLASYRSLSPGGGSVIRSERGGAARPE
jgi:integrase/recombinase XerD